MSESKFPPIDGGWCDGMGCSFKVCFCAEFVKMKEDYQRKFDRAWDNDDAHCKRHEWWWRREVYAKMKE